MQNWLADHRVNAHYIEPGSPWQNGYNERFNSTFRTIGLDRCVFASLTEARDVIQQWLDEFNTVRAHGSLDGLTPQQFLQQ